MFTPPFSMSPYLLNGKECDNKNVFNNQEGVKLYKRETLQKTVDRKTYDRKLVEEERTLYSRTNLLYTIETVETTQWKVR